MLQQAGSLNPPSLIKVENSYAWELAGYTALIIIGDRSPPSEAHLLEAPQVATRATRRVVLGSSAPCWPICCFRRVDQAGHPDRRWISCYRWINTADAGQPSAMPIKGHRPRLEQSGEGTTALDGMRNNLMMESSRWQKV